MSVKDCIWCGERMPRPKHNGDDTWEPDQTCNNCGMKYVKGLGWEDWQR